MGPVGWVMRIAPTAIFGGNLTWGAVRGAVNTKTLRTGGLESGQRNNLLGNTRADHDDRPTHDVGKNEDVDLGEAGAGILRCMGKECEAK